MKPDPARSRFLILQLVRLSGILMVLAGVLVWQSDLLVKGGAPYTGGFLIIAGLFDMIVLTRLLAAHWRTPPEDR